MAHQLRRPKSDNLSLVFSYDHRGEVGKGEVETRSLQYRLQFLGLFWFEIPKNNILNLGKRNCAK
jgi:hypothetical protein